MKYLIVPSCAGGGFVIPGVRANGLQSKTKQSNKTNVLIESITAGYTASPKKTKKNTNKLTKKTKFNFWGIEKWLFLLF